VFAAPFVAAGSRETATGSPDRTENLADPLALRENTRVATVDVRRCRKECDE